MRVVSCEGCPQSPQAQHRPVPGVQPIGRDSVDHAAALLGEWSWSLVSNGIIENKAASSLF